jgi:hypothetical protein
MLLFMVRLVRHCCSRDLILLISCAGLIGSIVHRCFSWDFKAQYCFGFSAWLHLLQITSDIHPCCCCPIFLVREILCPSKPTYIPIVKVMRFRIHIYLFQFVYGMRVHLCRSTFIIFLLSLLVCLRHESPPLSVNLYHIFLFVSQILFVWLYHISVIVPSRSCCSLFVDFVCRLGYSFFN